MDQDYLLRSFVHRVDVAQRIDTNDYGAAVTEYYKRAPCLVDESGGHRFVPQGNTETLSWDFLVSFGPTPFAFKIGIELADARDQRDQLIFQRARIVQVRTWRSFRRGGVEGYLVYAANVD